eukprot:6455943-Amphidinium_carterae.1
MNRAPMLWVHASSNSAAAGRYSRASVPWACLLESSYRSCRIGSADPAPMECCAFGSDLEVLQRMAWPKLMH